MPALRPSHVPAPTEYIHVRHIGDGEFAVLGSRTFLAVEPWTFLKTISGADLDRLPPNVKVIDHHTARSPR